MFGSLVVALVGAATATDVVSLREVAHAVNVPLLSGAVIGLREAMPGSVAHALEPLVAIAGLATLVMPLVAKRAPRWSPSPA
jgi:hypothetical protein